MEDLYFRSEKARTIFGLVKLEGKAQMDFLGIHYEHYKNRQLAKEWYTETKEKLKYTQHPKLNIALENLEKLYKGMR